MAQRTIAICGLLSVLTAAAFWPVLNNDFVHYDDPQYVTLNRHVSTGLTWENVGWAFRTGYASNWHPATWISHMLDAELFGLNPRWHHLTNLLLHIANVLLLFLVLTRMTGARWRSALVAALFAVHPLHVQSVAWVAERKDVLSTFFFMLTLWAYTAYAHSKTATPTEPTAQIDSSSDSPAFPFIRARGPGHRLFYYCLSIALFALGLMSKPMLVTVPFLLLLLDYWPLKRLQAQSPRFVIVPRLLLEKVPFLLLAVAVSAITFVVQSKGHAVASSLPLASRLPNALVSYWKYLGKMVWPSHLAIFYPFPRQGLPSLQFVTAGVLLVLVTVCAFMFAKRVPWFTTGWLWYLGTLVPVIGIIQVGNQGMADRYSYIPLIGAFICLVWGAAEFFAGHHPGRALPGSIALVVVGVCFALTLQQAKTWRNTFSVFDHALKVTSNNAVAHRQVAVEFNDRGEQDLAYFHFRKALEYDPNYPDVYDALGYAAFLAGRQEEAVELYKRALSLDPKEAAFHDHIAAALWRLGQRQEAVDHYMEALRLEPDRLTAQFALGLAFADVGDFAGAAARFTEAVRLKPDYAEARSRLAEALLKQGKLDQAERQFDALVRLSPTNIEARVNLGGMLWRRGQRNKAAEQYIEVLRLDPAQPVAHYNLGLALADRGDLAGAVEHFGEALRLKPAYLEALTGLGRVLTRQGKFKEAQERFTEAVRLAPTNASFQIILASALLMNGETNRADAAFAEALRLDPQLPEKLVNGAAALVSQGKAKAAIANYQQAIRLKPDSVTALNDLAWILATNPQADVRDGAEAVRLAQRACELSGTNDARVLGTLDAAYGEEGRFPEAIATAEKARDLALAAGQKSVAEAAANRIALYQKKQPYHTGEGPP
jgi:tetratricopeptide (TPR) repeat protein